MEDALGDLERDALGELLNIGLGRAACALSRMSGQAIEVYPPEIELFEHEPPKASNALAEATTLVQGFHGGIEGELTLCFPDIGAVAMVRSMIPISITDDYESALQDDILREVSNIVNHALVSSLADAFGTSVKLGDIMSLAELEAGGERDTSTVLRIRGGFELEDYVLGATLVLSQREDSYERFRQHVRGYVEDVLTRSGDASSGAA